MDHLNRREIISNRLKKRIVEKNKNLLEQVNNEINNVIIDFSKTKPNITKIEVFEFLKNLLESKVETNSTKNQMEIYHIVQKMKYLKELK